MSQIPATYSDPYADPYGPAQKTSGLAIGALVCSLIGIIPCLGLITGVLGIILGAAGLATIGKNPAVKGKGLCVAAIILGLIFVTTQIVVGKYYWDFFSGYVQYAMKGPAPALTAGFTGDIQTFKSEFHGAGATAADAEAESFITQLRSRYGNFVSSSFDDQSGNQPQTGQSQVELPYVLEFDNAEVVADVELIFVDKAAGGSLIKKLGYIIVRDPDQGDLAYPASASTARSQRQPGDADTVDDEAADGQDAPDDGG